MITKAFNEPRIIFQECDENGISEQAIACSIDSGGTVVLEQEGRHICISEEGIDDVIKVLREYKRILKESGQ